MSQLENPPTGVITYPAAPSVYVRPDIGVPETSVSVSEQSRGFSFTFQLLSVLVPAPLVQLTHKVYSYPAMTVLSIVIPHGLDPAITTFVLNGVAQSEARS